MTPPDEVRSAGIDDTFNSRERQRSYNYSLLTSLFAKASTALLQVLFLPMIAGALGSTGFALYAMINAAAAWLAFTNLGWGPNLSVRIASNRVSGNADVEKALFSSAFFSNLAVSALVVLSAALTVVVTPAELLFGPTYVAYEKVITIGLLVLILVFFCQVNLLIFESARLGYQRQYELNIVTTVSAIPTVAAVLLTLRLEPGPVELIAATTIPPVISRLLYATFVWWKNDNFRPRLDRYSGRLSRALAGDGLFYVLAGGVGNILAHVFPVLLVGRYFPPAVTASFSVTMTMVILLCGAMSIISAPLLPAMADSIARGNKHWAHSAYRRLRMRTLLFSTAIVAMLVIFRESIFGLWFKNELTVPRELLLSAGAYFIASAWELFHFSVLVGIGEVRKASLLVFARCILGAVLMIVLLPFWGESATYISMVFCISVVFSIPAVLTVRRRLLGD